MSETIAERTARIARENQVESGGVAGAGLVTAAPVANALPKATFAGGKFNSSKSAPNVTLAHRAKSFMSHISGNPLSPEDIAQSEHDEALKALQQQLNSK